MDSDVTSWLRQLSPEQLELVESRIDEIAAQKKEKLKNPGAVSLDELAGNLGIDISGLEKQIKASNRG